MSCCQTNLTNKYALGRKDDYERVQVVRVCASKPIQVNDRVTANRLGKNFKIWLGGGIASSFASYNEDGTISENGGGRIPSTTLQETLRTNKSTVKIKLPGETITRNFLPNH